jgi:hypothetical protein
MDGWFVFLVVIFAMVGVVIVVAAQRQEKERREKVERLARRLGFSYRQEGEPLLRLGLPDFQLFSRGRSRRHRSLLQGDRLGASVVISDYQYVTGSGRSQSTHRQTVLILESERQRLPAFRLRPEHLGDRLAAKLGFQDIDIPGQPLFSERFRLQGDDEEAIRACFDVAVIDFLIRHSGFHIEGQGGTLLLYRPRRRLPPEEIEAFLEQGLELARLLARTREWQEADEPEESSFMDEALAALQDLESEEVRESGYWD